MEEINNIFFSRFEQSWHFYLDIEKEVHKKIGEYKRQLSEDGATLFPEFIGFDERYTGLFREGLLIQLCSLLEYTMIQVCRQIVPDYQARIDKRKGNWLNRHLKLLQKEIVSKIEDKTVVSLSDFIRVRNCFVHSNGIVHHCRNSDKLEKSVERLRKLELDELTKIISISDNGYLLLGHTALTEAFQAGEEIIDPILEYAMQNRNNTWRT